MRFKLLFTLGLVCLPLWVPVVAQTNAVAPPCSQATLDGTYAGAEEGTFVAPFSGFPPPPLLFAGSTNHVYDGAGNFSGSATVSLNGAILLSTFKGWYTVNRDCTYSEMLTLDNGLVLTDIGMISGEGIFQQTHYVWSVPGTVVAGTLKKTRPGGCSVATLKGTYEGLDHGTVVGSFTSFGFPPPPFPSDLEETITYDGRGKLSGTGVAASFDGGLLTAVPIIGTYRVSPDCIYTDEWLFPELPGFTFSHTGTITGQGKFREIPYIYTTPGLVIAGIANRR